MTALSPRLAAVLVSLPLAPGKRVLEVGCGPGAMARAMAARVAPGGTVVAIDRSPRAIAQACAASQDTAASLLSFRLAAAETFQLEPGCRVVLKSALPQSVWRTILRTGRFRRDSDDFKAGRPGAMFPFKALSGAIPAGGLYPAV